MTMPSMTLFYGPSHRLNEAQFASLAEALTAAAEAILAAKGEKFRFCLSNLPTSHSGRPVGIEIKARAEPAGQTRWLRPF